MGKKNNKFEKYIIIMPIFCLIFGYLVRSFVETVRQAYVNKEIYEEYMSKNDESKYELSSVVSVDSVLSMLKGYYVDIDKINNKYLLLKTLKKLNYQTDLKVDISNNLINIIAGNTSQTLYLPKEISYNYLLSALIHIIHLIDKNSKGSLDKRKEQYEGLDIVLNTLLSTLDNYSSILSPKVYKELKEGTEGKFGGIGILVGIRDRVLTVIESLPRSPASRLGINSSDKILAINGMNTYGYSLEDLVGHMRGSPGTKVNLSLLRDGQISAQQVNVQREIIEVDSVKSKKIKSPYGVKYLYLSIDTFSMKTSDELKLAVKEYKRINKNLSGIILDLRSNPGGLLDQAIKVADVFFSEGLIVTTKGRHEEIEEATFGIHDVKCPVVVLLNEDSASASEIVAGALQDNHRGFVVGRPSYGKGSVQTIFELPEKRALKLTIAKYYTPSGRTIHNKGIIPNLWIQPIYKKDKNINLLGSVRYKVNQLNNILISDSIFYNSENSTTKYYYLDVDPSEDKEKDIDLDMALKVLSLAQKDELYDEVKGFNYRKYRDYLIPETKELELGVRKYLDKHFDLDWDIDKKNNMENISLTIDSKILDHGVTLKAGNEMIVPYEIKNESTDIAYRASVFIKSSDNKYGIQEQLIGKLYPKSSTKGQLKVFIPLSWYSGSIQVDVGIAIDGFTVKNTINKFQLTVKKDKQPIINAQVKLVDEIGGNVIGKLEAKEKARLEIKVMNEGEVKSKIDNVDIINLAGKQVTISKIDDFQPIVIHPNEEKVLFTDIVGFDVLASKDIFVGVYIESEDFESPHKETEKITAVPTKDYFTENIYSNK